MKGDFSIDRFDGTRHFNRVLKQQGRVDLDSDWNEQAAIGQHYLRTLIVDLFGRAAGPRDNCGFGIIDWSALPEEEKKDLKPAVGDFFVSPGRYYVDGLLVETESRIAYSAQPEWLGPKLKTGSRYLVYLDVWERHVTYIEDDTIREVALGGPDTCTRVKTSWQIKVLEAKPAGAPVDRERAAQIAALKQKIEAEKAKVPPNEGTIKELEAQLARLEPQEQAPVTCDSLLKPLGEWTSGLMKARLDPGDISDSPCVLPPDARYRGLENQLYRVEIHRGSDNAGNKPPTFKWSRENGAIVTRWVGTEGNAIQVSNSRGFAAGQWIEAADGVASNQGDPGKLFQIATVDGDLLSLDAPPPFSNASVTPSIRRWDQQANDKLKLDEGAIAIAPGAGEGSWIEIENGIEVQFSAGNYRTGDYWLIPARVVTGDIVWPEIDGERQALSPKGITHHYAALGMVDATAVEPFIAIVEDCRCRFAPLACIAPA